MRRGCLFGVIGALTLCLVACGLIYFVVIPRVRDNAQDGVRDAVGTQVAIQIPVGADNSIDPGTYELSADELQTALQNNVNIDNVEEIIVVINADGLKLGITSSGSETNYTGLPTAVDGKLVMSNMKASDGFLDFVFPANRLGDAIEDAVNSYLTTNNLQIESLTLEEGKMVLETVPLSS